MIELKSTGELFLLTAMYLNFGFLSYCMLRLIVPYYWILKHGGMTALMKFFKLSESRLGYDMGKYAALFTLGYIVDVILVLTIPPHSALVYPATVFMIFSGLGALYAHQLRKDSWAQFKSTAVEATFEAYP